MGETRDAELKRVVRADERNGKDGFVLDKYLLILFYNADAIVSEIKDLKDEGEMLIEKIRQSKLECEQMKQQIENEKAEEARLKNERSKRLKKSK